MSFFFDRGQEEDYYYGFSLNYIQETGWQGGKVGFGETGSDAAMAIIHIFGLLQRKKRWIL